MRIRGPTHTTITCPLPGEIFWTKIPISAGRGLTGFSQELLVHAYYFWLTGRGSSIAMSCRIRGNICPRRVRCDWVVIGCSIWWCVLKACSKCGAVKPLGDFYSRGGGRLDSRCKPCHNAQRIANATRPCSDCGGQCTGKRCKPCHDAMAGWHAGERRCAVDGCTNKYFCAGLCGTHYDNSRLNEERPCVVCGVMVEVRKTRKFRTVCGDLACKRENHLSHVARGVVKRRGVKGLGESFLPREIFDRDNWRCHICGCRVSKDVELCSPRFATLDHLVPLSLGGEHSRANVATACFSCNSRKGNRLGGDQLALFG